MPVPEWTSRRHAERFRPSVCPCSFYSVLRPSSPRFVRGQEEQTGRIAGFPANGERSWNGIAGGGIEIFQLKNHTHCSIFFAQSRKFRDARSKNGKVQRAELFSGTLTSETSHRDSATDFTRATSLARELLRSFRRDTVDFTTTRATCTVHEAEKLVAYRLRHPLLNGFHLPISPPLLDTAIQRYV